MKLIIILRLCQNYNEEKNYWELKEALWWWKVKKSDTGKNNLIEEGKQKGVDEIIKQNL